MYEVIRNFIDNETGEKHLVGAEYKPSSQKRGKELIGKGFLKEVKKTSAKKGDSNESGEA